jgi:hypothetical protein
VDRVVRYCNRWRTVADYASTAAEVVVGIVIGFLITVLVLMPMPSHGRDDPLRTGPLPAYLPSGRVKKKGFG